MSNNSEDHNNEDNSNDQPNSKQNNEKKLHDYEQDWMQIYQQPIHSPRFTPGQQYQLQPPYQQIPQFNLQENKNYEDYVDPSKQLQLNSDRKGQSSYPFRKHSIGDGQLQDHMEPLDDPKMPLPYQMSYYPPQPPHTQMKYPQQMFMPNKYPPQHPPQMQPQQYMLPTQQQQQWYRQQQQFVPPFYCYQSYENNQYQNTLSKELQSKVYSLVSYQKVSEFQCNCKKSKCLKLYCECFANNWVCSQSCNCQECKNRIDNPSERSKAIEEALLRNPDAFAQFFNSRGPQQYSAPIPAESKQHKEAVKDASKIARKGCNCKKSGCKKKYCECYSDNIRCSDLCKCENCLNRTDAENQANQQSVVKALSDQSGDKEGENIISLDIKKISKQSRKVKKEEHQSDSKQAVLQLQFKMGVPHSSKKKKQDKNN